eukprot:tig00000093_g3635.t1
MPPKQFALDDDEQEFTVAVIDCGAHTLKAGIAPRDAPSVVFPSVVARAPPDHAGPSQGGAYGRVEWLMGNEALERRDQLQLRRPTSGGIVTDFEAAELLWAIGIRELKADPRERPLLMVEPPGNPRTCRERTTQVFFEGFEVPSLYLAPSPALALYATGRLTAVIVESGEECTSVVPVVEGYIVPHAVAKMDVAGRQLTELMARLVADRAPALDREAARDMKEKLCYVAADRTREAASAAATARHERSFELPDGQTIVVGKERFECPEALFDPSLVGLSCAGLAQAVVAAAAAAAADRDEGARRELLANVVLSGGTTLVAGLAERLRRDVAALACLPLRAVNVVGMPERKYLNFCGASVLAALAPFPSMCIQRADYDEYGPSIVHRRCAI